MLAVRGIRASQHPISGNPGTQQAIHCMNLALRPAVPDDAPAIARVHIRTWQTAYRGLLPDAFLDSLALQFESRTEFWRSHIATPPASTEIWVAVDGPQVHGFVALGPARDPEPKTAGEVYAIYVLPDCWNQGAGRALFQHAAKQLLSLGFSQAMLWVLETNIRARRFYEFAGWTHDSGTKLDTLSPGIQLKEVSYRISFDHGEKQS